jgi:hypothetical protein
MGGIKNNIQNFGMQIGKGFGEIKDPIERHMAFLKQQITPYCSGCGKQLLDANQDESGAKIDSQAEQQRQMCTKCYSEKMEYLKKSVVEPKVDWEELKKKYIRE